MSILFVIGICELILLVVLIIKLIHYRICINRSCLGIIQPLTSIATFVCFISVCIMDMIHCYISYDKEYTYMYSTKYPLDITLFVGDITHLLSYLCLTLVFYFKVFIPFMGSKYGVGCIFHSIFWFFETVISTGMIVLLYCLCIYVME